MRRAIVPTVLAGATVVAGAAIWVAVAVATPGSGQTNAVLSRGTLKADLAFNTGLGVEANGLTWKGKEYAADRLPEFLQQLRTAGVSNLGEWLNLHPAASARFGMAPVQLLRSPQIVVQQARFAPGASSGWHSHPGYLTANVVSGQVVRYATDCSSETFGPGQSFYETGAKTFVVKNEGTADAVVLVTFVVPEATSPTGLRVDKPQPTACAK
jgi:quercetin dioxygenase-like cupin family protein